MENGPPARVLPIGTQEHTDTQAVPPARRAYESERRLCPSPKIQKQADYGITCHRSMQEWTCALARHGFHRLDRTLIVNPSQIGRLDRHSRNEAMLSFSNGVECLKIARVAMQRLRELAFF